MKKNCGRNYGILGALLLGLALSFGATEPEIDLIVREVHAKRLIAVLGEVESFKQHAFALVEYRAKQEPNISSFYWTRVRYELQTDKFEAVITMHYAKSFTADELRHIVNLVEKPKLRGLIHWFRELSKLSDAEKPAELERLHQKYGSEAFQALGGLIKSALGNQLLAVGNSALEIRNEYVVKALIAASERAQRSFIAPVAP
jgi:hypothetical protein